MQAGPFRAVTWLGRHHADRLGADRIAAGDGGLHRRIGGVRLSVGHAHHPHPGDTAGEPYPARPRRVHALPRFGGQVHTQVPRKPTLLGRIEAAQHLHRRIQRPPPWALNRGDGRCGSDRENGEQQEREEQRECPEPGVCHVSRVRAADAFRQSRSEPVDNLLHVDDVPGHGAVPGCARRRIESFSAHQGRTTIRTPTCLPREGLCPRSTPPRAVWWCGRGVRYNRRRNPRSATARRTRSWPQS